MSGWTAQTGAASASSQSLTTACNAAATASLSFNGTRVSIRSTTSPVGALASVTLDGRLVAQFNSTGAEAVVTSYTSGQLDPASPHTIALSIDTAGAPAWSCIGLDSFLITVRVRAVLRR